MWNLPAEIFVHFILILHPCVSIHKEFQEGKYSHETERDQGHWRKHENEYCTKYGGKFGLHCCYIGTCPTAGCGLHIALRHFGEGVQLLHQSQSLFLGKSPHFKRAEAGLTDSLIKGIQYLLLHNRQSRRFLRRPLIKPLIMCGSCICWRQINRRWHMLG